MFFLSNALSARVGEGGSGKKKKTYNRPKTHLAECLDGVGKIQFPFDVSQDFPLSFIKSCLMTAQTNKEQDCHCTVV